MPRKSWEKEIDISQLYMEYENDMDFPKYQKAVIAMLEEGGTIEEVFIQQLRDVVDDLDEWDTAMEDLYEYLDENRIWLRTI